MRPVRGVRCAVFGGSTLVTLLAVQSAKAQAQQDPIPGIYRVADNCQPAQFPTALPPLDSVLNLEAFNERLGALKVNKRVVLSLRLGTFVASPRVRVIEKKVSQELAEQLARLVDENLLVVPADAPWAIRLRIDPETNLLPALDRAVVCAAVPGPSMGTDGGTGRLVGAVNTGTPNRPPSLGTRTSDNSRFEILVNAIGLVVDLKISNTGGNVQASEATSADLKIRRFKPSTLDGEAVTAWVEIGRR